MSYFLSNAPLIASKIFELTGDEARHLLLSRRIKIGEIIEIQDINAKKFECQIISISKKSLTIKPLREITPPAEPPLEITIFQALIKEQPLDFIIQKATEIGVARLSLFDSKNSVGRFKNIKGKLERWKKIGIEAAKQSGRVKPIETQYIGGAEELIKETKELEKIFLLEPPPKADQPLAEEEIFSSFYKTWTRSVQVGSIGILVGPEGGFTEDEIIEFSKIKNLIPIRMGPRTLRAETAAITSSAVIQSIWGDM